MVDAAYDELFSAMRPGMRENDCVALVNKVLFELGSEHVEGVNAISGERCSPHPHVFTDRMLRPGDPAYFDILHAYNGYRTCYYRTFAVGSRLAGPGRRVQALPRHPRPGDRDDPAGCDDRRGRVESGPRPQEFGFPDEEAAFALQYGHGVGLSIWEKPIFSRLVSFDYPETIEEGMVFALETFWPAYGRLVGGADRGAARRHRGRLRGDHALPGRGAAGRRRGSQYTVGGHAARRSARRQSNLNNPRLEAVVASAAVRRRAD